MSSLDTQNTETALEGAVLSHASDNTLCRSVFRDGGSNLSARVTVKWIELINQMERSGTARPDP